jgi:multidrug resistance efflux pump
MLNISKEKVALDQDEGKYSSLSILNETYAGRTLTRILISLIIIIISFSFLPWQQNIPGFGTLTAFTPVNRPQVIPALITGYIDKWYVMEGQYVNKGDTILKLAEINEKFIDPELIIRTQEQLTAKGSEIMAKEGKAEALRMQISALKDNLDFKLSQLGNKINQIELKIQSDSAKLEEAKLNLWIQQDQSKRFKNLLDSGAISLNKFQEVDLKRQEAEAKITAAQNDYRASREELIITRLELQTTRLETLEKISKSESDLQATLADVYESKGSFAKIKNDLASLTMRNDMYYILAPQDGNVVKATRAGIGETVRQGEPVVTIAPSISDMAVELYIKPMDVTLVEPGRHVRLEFDGFPALQVTGWPQVAVGTFGGTVAVIDKVESPNGRFRVLVVPDPDDIPWPPQLRLGSGALGWVLLEQVPIWYEIWRQLNGFPPSLTQEPDLDDKKK